MAVYPETTLGGGKLTVDLPQTGNAGELSCLGYTARIDRIKGEEETDAIAVNCIRSGNGCAQADYRDKSLTTEHGMQLRLKQGDMGIVSLKEKLLLDDMEGIRIAGSGSLHILAAGEVKIAASEVRVAGTGGVILYEGTAEADREGNIVVAPQGKIELSAEDGERAIHNRGKEVTYYLAWEHEDLSHPSNRYRDAPQQKDYDWMKLGTHVAAGLMIAGGIAALAAGGVLLLGAAAATAIKIGMTVFLAGSLYVGEQALSDIRSGRVSDLDQYTRKAVAGSVVGFLTGASGLLMAEASLWGVLALGFGEGLVGSIVTQKLLNEDGEIDWGVAIAEAGFSAVTAGFAWKEGRSVRGVGSEALEGGTAHKIPDIVNFNSTQLGKKWGKHKADYLHMKSYMDYQNYANDVFSKPNQVIYDAVNNEYLYIKGADLLRVGEDGEFISLYPGAQSGRVKSAIENGGIVWP